MVNPVPGRSITTPYGKPGNWSGGRHGGADWAAPSGTEVVAMWGGTVTGASWGSAFGNQVVIDHDRLPDGSPGLWCVYAHLSRVDVRAGQRVEAGQRIGAVGSSGNATGPHLHAEVQRSSGWRSGNHVDPAPWVNAGGGGGSSSGAPTYLSKLRQGQMDSDSVRNLQRALNAHSLPAPGNITLPVTGNFLDKTAMVVQTCQRVHGFGNDPMGSVNVGPKQAAHLGLPDVRT